MTVTVCWDTCVFKQVVNGIEQKTATLGCFVCVFQSLINLAIRAGGIIVLVMFLVGGFRWITAGGDPKKAGQAWQTLTYAVFGLVLIIGAWFILLFIQEFTGIPELTKFKIGSP